MKTELITTDVCDTLMWWCGGCDTHHAVPVTGPKAWQWNGDRERPTLSPSVLVHGSVPLNDAEIERVMSGQQVHPRERLCHVFIRDGSIEYLGDCQHALAGQTVPLTDMD